MMERFGSGNAHCPENGSNLPKPTWYLSNPLGDLFATRYHERPRHLGVHRRGQMQCRFPLMFGHFTIHFSFPIKDTLYI
jgi:hypothetical protein